MTVSRPLCAVCHARPRASQSARCEECGPGRIAAPTPPSRRPRSRLDRAAELLDPAHTTEETP